MSIMANKAVLIAVSLLVTITITSGIIFTISQIKDIYSDVYKTDTSILQGFDEYDKYDNTVRTGIEMLNTANRYLDNPFVTVSWKNKIINQTAQIEDLESKLGTIASKEYNTKVERKDDYITIYFMDK